MTFRPASQKQFDLIKRLIDERELAADLAASVETARAQAVQGTLSARAASNLIDALFASPRTGPVPSAPAARPGFYVAADGTPVKVQSNKAGTGTYALTFSGRSWDYAPGLGRHFAGMEPMTAEQAARLGLASGRCIACCKTLGGETLTAKVAAVIGYGEICAGHHGWAFPKGAAAQRAYLAESSPVCGHCDGPHESRDCAANALLAY